MEEEEYLKILCIDFKTMVYILTMNRYNSLG